MGTTNIRAVLFDADGVVQSNPEGWLDRLLAMPDPPDGPDFVDHVFRAEKPAMTGEQDFRQVLRYAVHRWRLDEHVDELLDHWRDVEVSQPTIAVVRRLQDLGVPW